MKILKLMSSIVGTFVLALVLFLLFGPEPNYKTGFRTISEMREYGETIDEWIKMENKTFLFPAYENYYKQKFSQTFFVKIKNKIFWLLYLLGLKNSPPFSFSFFRNILHKIKENRISRGWQGDFVQKFDIKPTSKIVVFGTIQGAYHSLVRDLQQLKSLNIIDDDLKLKQSSDYIIFLGNVVNRSAYTIEILSMVLRLIEENHNNIIYLKGTNEFPDYWRQHSLKRELDLAFGDNEFIQKEVDSLFATLPVSSYGLISFVDLGKRPYCEFSPYIGDQSILAMLEGMNYADLFNKKSENLSSHILGEDSNEKDMSNMELKARVIEIRKRDYYEQMNGLRLIAFANGVPTWNVFSSPAEPFRIAIKFYYDAFAVIAANSVLDKWSISLYNRDIRNTRDKIFQEKKYQFYSGDSLS